MVSRKQRARGTGTPAPEGRVTVKGVWQETHLSPIFVNQIFLRFHDDYVFMTLGEVELPREVTFSQPTIQRLEKEGVPIHPVARFTITPTVLDQFIEQLQVIQGKVTRRPSQIAGAGQKGAQP